MSKILLKEKPILRRSDIIEMYDRSRFTFTDLLGIAYDKQCHITVHISPDGIMFRTQEFTQDKCYEKTQTQTNNRISYVEAETRRSNGRL